MARIFFSYANEDKDKVLAVKNELEMERHEIWFDKDKIDTGKIIPQAIQIGIQSCDYFAVFLTKNAEKSSWVKRELATFLMRDLADQSDNILPLRVRRVYYLRFWSSSKFT